MYKPAVVKASIFVTSHQVHGYATGKLVEILLREKMQGHSCKWGGENAKLVAVLRRLRYVPICSAVTKLNVE